ncbi:hypothetical protein [Streptomyces sp. NL15-2K]|nr:MULTISPECIES: hypothetical protein [Actinomycetes]WKX06762.1 hypothetical protein Q4V64_04320 [Kutzneria buriramensis]
MTISPPAPIPCTAREAMSIVMPPERPQRNEPVMKTIADTAKM